MVRSVATTISVVLGSLVLVFGLSGCDAGIDISARLQGDISRLEKLSEFGELSDLGDLAEPNPDIRSIFTSTGSVYRVIDASVDHALIAVWRVTPPEGESVGDFREFTASACASLDRKGTTVTSTVVDCPHPLAEFAPSAESEFWTRNAASIELAVASAHQLNSDLRWLLFHVDGGGYRSDEAVSISDVAHTIDSAELSTVTGSVDATTTALQQHDNHVTGTITITASAPDETDTQSKTTATVCFALDLDLAARAADHHSNWTPVTETRC